MSGVCRFLRLNGANPGQNGQQTSCVDHVIVVNVSLWWRCPAVDEILDSCILADVLTPTRWWWDGKCRIERRHYQWPWTTPNPVFKVTSFFWRWISHERLNIQPLLQNANKKPYQAFEWCQWPWVTLSEIMSDTKYRAVSLRQLSFLSDLWTVESLAWPDLRPLAI